MSLNVLHVTPYMHPAGGGPPVVIDRLCRQFAQRGHQSEVVATDLLADGPISIWAQPYRDAYPCHIFAASGPGSFAYSSELRRFLAARVIDFDVAVIHTCWTYPGRAAMLACLRGGVPFITMPHGMLDPHSLSRKGWKKRLYGHALEWPLLRRAAAMLYTHAEEQRLAEQSVAGLPRGAVAPLGTDLPPDMPRAELAAEFYARHPDLAGKPLAIFLSRLHAKKGLDLLIPAFARVVSQRPDARLAIVGDGDPEYVAQLRRLVEQSGASHAIRFTGTLAGRAKWAALAAADLMLLPSYQENFGLVVTESLVSGTPVVLSRRVNIWQDVVEGGGGFACELDPTQIAALTVELLDDPDRLRAAGEQGRRLAAQRFTWRGTADVLQSLCLEITSSARSSRSCVKTAEPATAPTS